MTLPPERIGFKGQLWAIVVDEAVEEGGRFTGEWRRRVLGWTSIMGKDLRKLEVKPTWRNARYERCDPQTGQPLRTPAD